MFDVIKKVVHDCLTCQAGDYDPARVIGYLMVLVTFMTWLVITVYFVVATGKFDSTAFCRDAATLAALLVAAAAGVWIKDTTEKKTS